MDEHRPTVDAQARSGADPLVGRSLAGGKFAVLELLGSGGAGNVYKARHRELQKLVAVKVLHPSFQRDLDFCRRFYGEALAASKLDHPNVLRILDFGQEPDGMLYIAMELLAGKNLGEVLQEEGRLTLERVVDVMMQVCAALGVAHEQGIVHRDIKPENIVLVPGKDDDGAPIETVKVCDFGIAERRSTQRADVTTKRAREVAGTPLYMSPEQARGEELDERSDIYACGVVLYELATGRVPFDDPDPMAILKHHCLDEPLAPSAIVPEIDPLLESITLKAMHKQRDERHQTARELRADLRELLKPVMVSRAPSVLPVARGRREVRDASQLAALSAPESGFLELTLALVDAIAKTGSLHGEDGLARARLFNAAYVALNHRVDVTFTVRGDARDVFVLTGVGEAHALRALLPAAAAPVIAKLGDAFARRQIAALSIADGIDDAEIASLLEIFAAPPLDPDSQRVDIDARLLVHVRVLLDGDMLGLARPTPWNVDVTLSRLAQELRSVAMTLGGADPYELARMRIQLFAEAVRTTPRTDDTRALLANADLVARAIAGVAALALVSPLDGLVSSLPRERCEQVAALVVSELGRGSQDGVDDPSVLAAIATRFLAHRHVDTDALLLAWVRARLLDASVLPSDLRSQIAAEHTAKELVESRAPTLPPLSDNLDHLANELAQLERSMTALARAGEAVALWAVVSPLRAMAEGAADERSREAIAASALRSLEDPALLTPIAAALLRGERDEMEAARAVLAGLGVAAAHALFDARANLPPEKTMRTRFIGMTRELGAAAWPALAIAVDQLQWGAAEETMAEDVKLALRGLVEDRDEAVRAAAIAALRAVEGSK